MAILKIKYTVMNQYFSKQPGSATILKSIPQLKQPHKLLKLEYSHNNLQKIDIFINKAVNLQQIDLSHNKIAKMEILCSLKRLKVVNLSYNNICEVGKGIVNLTLLREINLSYNLITKLKAIAPLGQLYKVVMGTLNVCLQGNDVLKCSGRAIAEMFQPIPSEKTQQFSLDISLPFSKDSKELTLDGTKYENKSLQTRKKLQYSFLTSRPDDLISKKNDSLLLPISDQKLQKSGLDNFVLKNQQGKQPTFYLERLVELEQKFKILQMISQLKNNKKIGQQYQRICESAQNCIQIYRNLMNFCQKTISNTMNNLEEFNERFQKSIIQASEEQQLIKDQHQIIMDKMTESQQIPIKFYIAWVNTYRYLRENSHQILQYIKLSIRGFIRNREMEDIMMISPDKNGLSREYNKEESADNLSVLLFSKKKKQFQNQSQNQNKECQQCLIKSEHIKQLLEQNNKLKQQNSVYSEKIKKLESDNNNMMVRDSHLGNSLRSRQITIIDEIKTIQPSAYQYILLNQAKGIEDLIKVGFHDEQISKNSHQNETYRNIPTKQRKTDFKTNIPIKSPPLSNNAVSQFVYGSDQRKQSSSALSKKYPYFNNNDENNYSYKVSRKNTDNSVDSTEKKSKSRGHQNSIKNNSQIEPKNRKLNQIVKCTEKMIYQKSVLINKGMNIKNQQQYEVAEFLVSEPASKQIRQHYQKHNKQNINLNNQIESNNSHLRSKGLHISKTNPHHNANEYAIRQEIINKYSPIKYTSIKLKDEEPYEKYMKHHLRNSIIDVLTKKGRKPVINSKITSQDGKNASIYCSILHQGKDKHTRTKSGDTTSRVRANSETILRKNNNTHHSSKYMRGHSNSKIVL